MNTEFFRKYIDIVNESQQAQLNEGVMDMLNPYIKKAANALMAKFDPETIQGLKQAYDQSGGDKNKFMSAIGIGKQDLAPLVSDGKQQVGELFGSGKDLKGKVLSGIFNIVPMVGIVDLLLGGNIGKAIGGDILPYVFYIVSAALIWGVGNYDFNTDKDAPKLPNDTGM